MPKSVIETRLADIAPLVRKVSGEYGRRILQYGDYIDDLYSEGLIAAWRYLEQEPDASKGQLIVRIYYRIRSHVYTIQHPEASSNRGWTGKARGNPYTRQRERTFELDVHGTEPGGAVPGADAWIDAPENQTRLSEDMQRALSRLRGDTRETFLRYADGESIGSLAERYGLPYDSIACRISRGRKYLAASLKAAA